VTTGEPRLAVVRPLLLIGHDPNETFGLAVAAFEAAGLTILEHRSGAGATLPSLDGISGLVMFGGSMNVDMTDRYPFLAEERALVRAVVDADIPYLGICLGAQMLARAMDRKVFPAGVREFGFTALHPTPEAAHDPLVSVFVDDDLVFHWHEDTFELPHGATLLARGDHVPLQAFRVGERAWGLQFHLEVDRPELELWLKAAGDDVVRAWGKTSEQVIDEADLHLEAQEAKAREVFHRFADVVDASV
jgi:GMP synthase (glutamine-hydrolysing)